MRQPDRADPAGEPDPFDPPPSSWFGDSEPWRSAAPSNGDASLLKVLGLVAATGAITYGGMLALQTFWPGNTTAPASQARAPSEQNICTAADAAAPTAVSAAAKVAPGPAPAQARAAGHLVN